MKVLIVDDEPVVREVLRTVLSRAGYGTSEAATAAEGEPGTGSAMDRQGYWRTPGEAAMGPWRVSERAGVQTGTEAVR